jgi:hypothetical protein
MICMRSRDRGQARLRALRELYRSFLGENTPEARGRRLLCEWLSDEQRAQFQQHCYFDVVGCNSGKRYRIHYGANANIHEIDPCGAVKMGWCFLPSGYLAPGDVMLAQKIALETDENAALAVANRFPSAVPAERPARRPF